MSGIKQDTTNIDNSIQIISADDELDSVLLNELIIKVRFGVFSKANEGIVLGLYAANNIAAYHLVEMLRGNLKHAGQLHKSNIRLVISPQSYLIGILDTVSRKVVLFDDNPNSSESQSSSKEKPAHKQRPQGRQAVEKQAKEDRLANVVEQVSRLLQLQAEDPRDYVFIYVGYINIESGYLVGRLSLTS